ncbi:MAG: hypothetical protein Q8Q09_26955 [Deltaproteobacteria bacterium]|nr:hypothetical protein [Deltaproteobacteria bacterium]
MSTHPVETPAGPVSYCALFCEENVWWLLDAAHKHAGVACSAALVVSNAHAQTALMAQRASARDDGLVLWDYHVLAAVCVAGEWQAWDPDSCCPMACPWETYARASFGALRALEWLDPVFSPRVRVIEGGRYLREFSSDRSHMRDASGAWQSPPPSWPALLGPERVLSLAALRGDESPVVGPWRAPDDVPRALAALREPGR